MQRAGRSVNLPAMTRRFPITLACSSCESRYAADRLINVCPSCGGPILVDYAITAAPELRAEIRSRRADMWRYLEVLPPGSMNEVVTIGEGMTPLLRAERLGRAEGFTNLFIKDESKNPTRSFKSRGMAVAVTMARTLGAKSLGAPTAGNAGCALAAYGARAGLPVFVAMPR